LLCRSIDFRKPIFGAMRNSWNKDPIFVCECDAKILERFCRGNGLSKP
jgi:hypothetical protein